MRASPGRRPSRRTATRRSRRRAGAARPRSGPCTGPASRTAARRGRRPPLQIASQTGSASSRPAPDLVAEVARVAGPRDAHLAPADLRLAVLEVAELLDAAVEPRQHAQRPRALDREDGPVVGDVLDRDLVAGPDEVGEPGEVGLGGREDELVVGVPEQDAVLDDEPAVVAPDRVLRLARLEVRGSRASTPARYASAPGPENRYLNSGEVSKIPAALRTATYSNFSDSWYFSAARRPAQWLHRPVSLSTDVRSWNGVVPIIQGGDPLPTTRRSTPAHGTPTGSPAAERVAACAPTATPPSLPPSAGLRRVLPDMGPARVASPVIHERPAVGEAHELLGFQRAVFWLRLAGAAITVVLATGAQLTSPILVVAAVVLDRRDRGRPADHDPSGPAARDDAAAGAPVPRRGRRRGLPDRHGLRRPARLAGVLLLPAALARGDDRGGDARRGRGHGDQHPRLRRAAVPAPVLRRGRAAAGDRERRGDHRDHRRADGRVRAARRAGPARPAGAPGPDRRPRPAAARDRDARAPRPAAARGGRRARAVGRAARPATATSCSSGGTRRSDGGSTGRASRRSSGASSPSRPGSPPASR